MGLNRLWSIFLGFIFLVLSVIGFTRGGFSVDYQGISAVIAFTNIQNGIYLLTSIFLLIAGITAHGHYSKFYNLLVGISFFFLTMIGFYSSAFGNNFLNLDSYSNVLHLLIAVIASAIGTWAPLEHTHMDDDE